MSESRNSLEQELRQEDEEYRYAYAEDFLNTSVATQIRVLREQRGMTQDELAQKIGTKQAGISRLENVNYSAWKTETLRKIARALKVRLKITFETFGSLIDEAEAFSRKNLERPTFEDDPVFHESVVASAQIHTTTAPIHNTLLIGSFQKSITSMPRVSTIDVGQIAIMVQSGSEVLLSQNMIPSQPVKSTDATHNGEIKDGGRTAS